MIRRVPTGPRLSRAAFGVATVALLTPVMTSQAWAAPAPVSTRPAPSERPRASVVYPKLVKFVKAVYPEFARKANRQGVVVLHVTVGVEGKVTAVSVARSGGVDFDAAAMKAVRQFVYKPALVNGKPMSVKITVSYPFTLRGVTRAPKRPAVRPLVKRRPPPQPRATKVRSRKVRPRKVVRVQPIAVLAGRVRERGTRKPLEDAEILVYRPIKGNKGPGRLVARGYVNRRGRFKLTKLPPGRYHVLVRSAGCRPFRVTELLVPGVRLSVDYFVGRRNYDPYETVVLSKVERKEVSRHIVALPEVQKIPGTGGDALRAVQNMPGVARAPFGAGLLVVRGSSPESTRVMLEGHEIPQLFHFGGLTSVFNSDILRQIVFIPGNFSVEYGRVGASIIDVYARAGKKDRWQGYIDLDIWDGGFLLEGPVGKGSLAIAARRSWIDAIISALPKGTMGNYTMAPVYYDYQAMFDYPVAKGHLKLLAFGSDDRMKMIFDDAGAARNNISDLSQTMLFHRLTASWRRKWGKHTVRLSVSGGFQRSEVSMGDSLKVNIDYARFDWRLHYAYQIHKKLSFAVGTVGEVAYWWVDLMMPPAPAEGEVPLPLSSSERFVAQITTPTTNQAAYLELTYKPFKSWTLVPGMRVEYAGFGPFKGVVVQPRFTTKVQVHKRVALTAAVGLYHQHPEPTDVLASIGGNPDVKHEPVLHTSLGMKWQATDSLSIEATGFYKHQWDRIVGSDRVVVRDGELVPENRRNVGLGRVYGGELMIRKQADHACPKWLKMQKCFGWISYTALRSERKDDPSGGYWRLFDWDQTHMLTLVVSGAWAGGWELGIRFRLSSGIPYTPLTMGILDSDSASYIPTMGRDNIARMPLFHQLDIRLDKKFVFKRWMLALYLDIQNAYFVQAKEFPMHNFNYTKKGWVRGLPIIPSLGLKASF